MRAKTAVIVFAGVASAMLLSFPVAPTPPPTRQFAASAIATGSIPTGGTASKQCPLQRHAANDTGAIEMGAIGTLRQAAGTLGSVVSASPVGCLGRMLFSSGGEPGQKSAAARQASCPIR